MDVVDLNHGSGFVYGIGAREMSVAQRVNTLIDAALLTARREQLERDYLGASRLGEPCCRRLAYEVTHTPSDDGQDLDGAMLRVFEAGHRFEALSIEWLRAAGFDLRTQRRDGSQFGFAAAGGRLRGHIDGVIVAGPNVGVPWPALWEHKALNTKSWNDIVKRGLRAAKPLYFAQVQIYMAYMEIGATLFSALNKDSQALHHEVIAFEPAEAQALSDKAVDILRAVETGELPPRIAAASDYYLCRFCPYARRCWEE
ncbi:MAG: PD-(D/E)XK nuclease family protein [Pseudolabrys sp.]|jgi:hypothetical protein|nr:PD-(D/E)XK nuclease family protein [Pseudolabrys sp.]